MQGLLPVVEYFDGKTVSTQSASECFFHTVLTSRDHSTILTKFGNICKKHKTGDDGQKEQTVWLNSFIVSLVQRDRTTSETFL